MENNTQQYKGNYPMSHKDFVEAWKISFQKALKEQYGTYKLGCYIQCWRPVSYNDFCEYVFMTDPKSCEHNNN